MGIVYIKISAYEFKYKFKPKRLQFIKVAQCLFGHLIVIKYYSLYKVFSDIKLNHLKLILLNCWAYKLCKYSSVYYVSNIADGPRP